MIKAFEIDGSNNPDADGGWGNWELLGSFTSVKPSGLPFGSTTTEDVEYAVINGEDFDFDGTMSKRARYIRFKTDRKSVVEGKSVSVRVDLGGRRIIKTKKHKN